MGSTTCTIVFAGTQRPGKGKWHGSLAKEWPEVEKQWAQELNDDVTPESVSAGSQFRAAWQCERGCGGCGKPHMWYAPVRHRCIDGTGCPICVGGKVCSCQSLAKQHPRLMLQWDYKANKGVDPEKLACQSQKRVSWTCLDHGQWAARILDRVKGTGCPACSLRDRGHSKRGFFKDERPDLYAEVHPTLNIDIDVSQLTCGSNKEIWWLCKAEDSRPEGCTCEHVWNAPVSRRCQKTTRLSPSKCPFCTGNVVCLCKSIAKLYPYVMPFWCYAMNSRLDPEAVGAGSRKEAWWQHVCVDGQMKLQESRVFQVVRQFKDTGRLCCRACSASENSSRSAEHHARLIKRG